MIYILACFGVVALLGVIAGSRFMRYRYDECNPFRRYCVMCGQQQNKLQTQSGGGHWATVGRAHSPTCHCHADVQP